VTTGLRALVDRLISIADEPADDDDLRLRKRLGVATGYITAVAALTVIPSTQQVIALPLGLSLSVISIVNLVVLAQSRRLERYVVVLITAGTAFTVLNIVISGGVMAAGAAMLWAFLGPVYAMLALGPRRATVWLVVFLLALALIIVADPFVSAAIHPSSYSTRLVAYAISIAGPATIIFLLFRYSELRRREAQARSDELLFNAIPISIAGRLKHGDERIADAYPETTVLFTDLAGFTPWAQRTDPEVVVSFLDDLFSRFDALAAASGVEKIKTIGDSYMAVAGAPVSRPDHAEAALALARGMLHALADARATVAPELEMRIGLASGPVVGGVIGQRRILFDLWGDTVNLASRMESAGVAGRIQVAPSSWELLRDRFDFEAREPMEVKGLGRMTTYLLVES
jgi:adenylate cyclase